MSLLFPLFLSRARSVAAPLVLLGALGFSATVFATDNKVAASASASTAEEIVDTDAGPASSASKVTVEKLAPVGGPTPAKAAPVKPVPGEISAVCKAKYGDSKSPNPTANQASGDDDLQNKVKDAVAGGDVFWALILIALAGFLTALSPCVYPLIPITLSIFGARQASTKTQGFLLSSSYVGGMVLLYTTLGTSFAAFGFLAGSALQSPLITIGVAVFCIVMAVSMFGAFDFALPQSLQQKLNTVGGNGYRGAFLMGLVAGIIAAPCTGPVLSFILTLIAKNGNVAQGALYMFVYALGMGLPFLVLGTFSTFISRIPKSGKWMDVVKSIFGILMLVAGLYYLQFGIASVGALFEKLAAYGWLAGGGAVVAGLAIGALQLSFKYSGAVEKLRKASGVFLVTLGMLTTITWITQTPEPKASLSAHSEVKFVEIGSEEGGLAKFDLLLAQAKAECKPVMVDFFADWCAACKELDKFTYPDAAVAKESERFTNIKIDATSEGEAPDALQERYGVVGLPTVLFFNGSGELQSDPRVLGLVMPEKYVPKMKQVR